MNYKIKHVRLREHLLFLAISSFIFVCSLNEGFFWDNITFGYKMGLHLYENGLFHFNFPDSFDPGHPPFLAFIQASAWRLFGKTLFVSHVVLLPFIYGLLVQLHIFVKQYTNNKSTTLFAFILLLAEPTLAAQFVLIGPEIIQLFFFFLALNNILRKKNLLKTIGLFFLGIVSFRGMLLFAGIFLFDILRHLLFQKKTIIQFLSQKNLLTYFTGAIPAFAFIFWRLTVKGWLQTHPNSPWKSLWHFVNFPEFLRNLLVLGQRYVDFGRIAIFIFIIYILATNKNLFFKERNKELFLLAICSVLPIIIISLLAVNPFGHRYFIVSYLTFFLIAYRFIQSLNRNKKTIYIILIGCLIGGNFWVYPEKISQGWDASLAHMPYFELRSKAIGFLDSENIRIDRVTTFFPNTGKIDIVDLSGDLRVFQSTFTGDQPYLFYSNVYNLEDKEYDWIENNYTLLKQFSSGQIRIEILKHK